MTAAGETRKPANINNRVREYGIRKTMTAGKDMSKIVSRKTRNKTNQQETWQQPSVRNVAE
jgi:hypothetical protein